MLCKLEPINTVYDENMHTTIDFIKRKTIYQENLDEG